MDIPGFKMIEMIKEQIREGIHRFTVHGLERCVERCISPNEVKCAILSGEIIEKYPEDKYGPSCLICGVSKEGRILHMYNVLLTLFGLLLHMIQL